MIYKNRDRAPILIGILGLILTVGGGFAWFKFYWTIYKTQKELAQQLEKLQQVPAALVTPVTQVVKEEVVRPRQWIDVQSKIKDSVAQVFAQIYEFNWIIPYKTPNQYQTSGSAFFISENGELITNAHVVKEAKIVAIQIPSLGKQQIEVSIIGLSPDRDLALLKVNPEGLATIKAALGKVPYVSLGNSDMLHRADEVMALGYPLGQQSMKSTTGVVSGRENMMGQHLIQISAPINPGSSGGPLINMDGEVMGVSVAGILTAQNVGYCIPSNDVVLFINQLKKINLPEGSLSTIKVLSKPFLGVLFCNATQSLIEFLHNPAPGGLYVVEVTKGSPLEKAGVKSGDMIYEINGISIDMYGELTVPWSEDKISMGDYISRLVAGDRVDLLVYRRGKKMAVSVDFVTPNPNEWPLRKNRMPGIDYNIKDYEILAGLVIMPFALNHIPLLIQQAPHLAKYTEMKNQLEPALIIPYIIPGSRAAKDRVLGVSAVAGAIIDRVNGQQVKTLDALRAAVQKSLNTGYLEIETADQVPLLFKLTDILEEAPKLARDNYYLLSPFIQELIKKAHLKNK